MPEPVSVTFSTGLGGKGGAGARAMEGLRRDIRLAFRKGHGLEGEPCSGVV